MIGDSDLPLRVAGSVRLLPALPATRNTKETMLVFIITAVLLAIWFFCWMFLGKTGFIHMLLLTAISTGVVQLVANHRSGRY